MGLPSGWGLSCDGADWLEVRDGMLSTDKWLATYRDPMANGCEGAEPAQAKALGVGPERGAWLEETTAMPKINIKINIYNAINNNSQGSLLKSLKRTGGESISKRYTLRTE